jgi:uncharacterized membrane protein (UPF0182 family)
MPWRRFGLPIAVIVALLVALGRISGVVVDWAWFSSIGYVGVFWTVFGTKAILFVVAFATASLFLWVNGALAFRFAWRPRLRLAMAFDPGFAAVPALPGPSPELFGLGSPTFWHLLILAVSLIVGLLIAMGETGNWNLILRFIHQVPYGQNDPLFNKDISFYLFSLPLYVAFKNWLLWILLLSGVITVTIYFVFGEINLDRFPWRASPAAIAHGSVLLGLYFLLKAWSYAFDRFLLLYDDNGVVVGAGYTDVHVELPVLWLLIGLAAVAAVVCWANVWLRTYRALIAAVVLVFGTSFVSAEVFPGLFERFYVKPSELQLETPFLRRDIALTQEAYNLRQITVKPFAAEQNPSFQSLQDNRGTIDNIRLWDWQPLMDTYEQLQEIRTYYRFLDVDIDRYHLDGSYQQVMLAARELAPSLLAANAQTWVNLHLLFTHGTGVVMSPVTRKSTEGLPIFYLKDIPPVASGGPVITEPRIYFGQSASEYVIVKSSIPEFDYPKGGDNVYANYDGADGIPIGGTEWRALFAWYFDDVNILLSRYITNQSRIMIHRNIQERVHTIAPFLQLDHDPYMVISGGRLFWMQDAYTMSEWFPYSRPQADSDINYIRNSVKAVIDAYNGTVTFYVADTADPLVATYRRIFPRLFKPFDAMPLDLQSHIRYPEDLFTIQALQYRAYHMNAPEVFYNREDLWQFPREPTSPDGIHTDGAARMAPYYIMMRLPGESRTQFFLMVPMAPSQRENMIAWLAARCDLPDYGKLIVYEFPKEKLVYGPFQIEARINQNTEISQQISLWNQMGSRVIRGNLLVVPIGNSLLYVSPLYLRAESGQLPELKRVIAAYGDRVVMEETLPTALAALFKESVPLAAPSAGASASAPGAAREALGHYDRAIERLKVGDWSGFGAELDALRRTLEELTRQPPTR